MVLGNGVLVDAHWRQDDADLAANPLFIVKKPASFRTQGHDHRVVEFTWNWPLGYKLRDGVGKGAMRQMLSKYVPKELIERPRMGFSVPTDSRLRGTLRDWAKDLLSESRLRQEGYFNPAPIRQKWGARNWQYHLWNVLMFQVWFDQQNKI